MELIYDYIRNDALRHQLNALTRKTFSFDFEKWVANGYYEGDYIPYSFVENGKMLSNVSANRMRFLRNGVEHNYIQIGTVMTDEVHRNKGLARRLIEYVVAKYKDKCDGIYLFANLEALGFYRKTGFSEGVKEYRCTLKPNMIREWTLITTKTPAPPTFSTKPPPTIALTTLTIRTNHITFVTIVHNVLAFRACLIINVDDRDA